MLCMTHETKEEVTMNVLALVYIKMKTIEYMPC